MTQKIEPRKWDTFKIGLSSAASWAWGTSLIMGQQIVQEKGLVAWLIWATCNALTLALFGYLYKTKKITPEIYNRKVIKAIAIIIQLFCLLVQLNFINQQLTILLNNDKYAYIGTIFVGIIFTMIVFRGGVKTSIFTDVFQWLIAIATIFVILGIAFYTGADHIVSVETTGSGVLWGVWSGFILFAGPIGDAQHWQRGNVDNTEGSGNGYYIGAIAFAVYMALILAMAQFEFSRVMNIILLMTVLCVATSTIDSIASALHEVRDKFLGTAFALFVCLFFGFFIRMGMIEFWSSFGIIRFTFAVAILLIPFCIKKKSSVVIPSLIATVVAIAVFSILGQTTITSMSGIVSAIISAGIIVYVLVCLFKKDEVER